MNADKAVLGKPSDGDIERLYRSLRRIRRIEEEVAAIYPSDKIKSPVHLSIGQEAVSVGVIDVLQPSDVVAGSYRGHAVYLAKGGDLKAMLAEMYGRQAGCARGKGGSMHLVSAEHNMIGASAVVGTQIPHAVGYALALKREGTGRVAVVFLGDGATEEGVFYESLNFASLHKLPVMFVCENNRLAIHTPLEKRWASEQLCERVATFGMPTERITDGDVFQIRAVTEAAVAAMRAGAGPFFLECDIYRWREHVGPAEDFNAGYRDRSDLEPWVASDQVARLADMVEPARRASINAEIEAEIAAAVDYAEQMPFPEPEELYDGVFAS
jgi:pyruvate dehydrogenase E1 component alpha subunit